MRKLFLLEDDLSLISGLTFAFKKQGFALDTARTLAEAEVLWSDGKYDLLVLDVSLPDGSGFGFCQKVRRTSNVPILFLTASDEEMNIIMGLDMGGDDYLTKPFKLGVLLSRVNALLRRANASSAGEPVLESGSITVRLLQGQAYKNGILLELTSAEYKLLCFFMQHPNAVLSKEQILDALWDCDGDYIDSSALTVYIRRLRMKIEDDPGKPQMLLTVRGMGYKWNGERCRMKVFANREIRILFRTVLAVWAVALALTQGIVWHTTHVFSFGLLLVFLLLGGCLWGVLFRYFQRQSALLEQAVQQIQSCLDGNPDARLDCDREGELYRLFHSVNALTTVLSAHADNEQREKRFLKNTIADISHQLKTPLAALNIYNGLLQDEAVSPSEVKEFADLSEQELDRIETLVQNLLKITRLDAGSVVLEKKNENVDEMVQDIARQYNYRAEQEQKKLVLSGSEAVTLWCDRDWMQEAVDNLVKNALDHTKSGDTIQVEWNALPSMVQIKVRDNGSGIHPEDLYHIFKRFYRSRFSQDTQGIGLGLPLAKAVVEAHHGTIEVDSELGKGTTFTLNFPIPTKL